MDEIDIEIIKLLIINSRLSYREISDFLGLSINAIYRRIQNLIDLNIIQKFTTKINPNAINAIYTFIFGETKAQDLDEMASKLGKHENTYNIMLSSRNHVYVGALLRNIHELDEYSSFISQAAELQSTTLGLLHKVYYSSPIRYNNPISRSSNFDKLDLEIIRSLTNDSRKTISEVAEDIDSTSKTVRRRLSRMMDEGVIRFTINFNPFSSDFIFALLQINLKLEGNKEDIANILVNKYNPFMFFCWSFSNIPNFLLCYTWSKTINDLNELIKKVKKEKIESIAADVLFKELYYETWRDKIVLE
ncbi:MAG: Lrp/AsnC family transcriptional regulator [Candidatus Thorarchaeota archaeon]